MHSLSQGYFQSYMLSITHAFIQRCVYTETPLHRDAFAQGCFHTQTWFFTHILLQRDDFTLSNFTHKCQNKQSHFYKRNVSARGIFTYGYFYTDILLHDFRRRTRIWRKRTQQACAKSHFHHSFWRSRRISWDRVGPAQAHIAFWPQCMMIDISRKRVVFHGHQYMLPWRSKRSFRKIKIVVAFKKLIAACVFTSAPLHLRISTCRCFKTIIATCTCISSAIDLHTLYYIYIYIYIYIFIW